MILSKAFATTRAVGSKTLVSLNLKNAVASKISIRCGGGGRRIMRARTLPYTGFKDLAIRYSLIGFVPAFAIISYCNLFIGNAVLHDYDPEVFEPEHWEYYKHPITRFLAKYVMEDPKMSYYKDIYLLECAQRDSRQIRLVTQVEKLQKAEQQGMLAWQETPAIPRALRDDIDDYVEQNLRKKPED